MTNKQIYRMIEKAKNIALFAHTRPDPDAYGSLFAMRDACRNLGKNAEVFEIKTKAGFLDKIFPLEQVREDFKAADYDLAIVLDIRDLSRVDDCFLAELKKMKNILNIDHHEGDKTITSTVLIDPTAAATCQLIAQFMLENNLNITPDIATYLWAGLIGDTNRFLNNNLSKDVLIIASILFEKGADTQKVYDSMYRTNSFLDIKIRDKFIKNTKYFEGGKVGVTIFSFKDMEKLGIDKNMLDKFVNSVIEMDGVKASFLCVEISPKNFKVSIRTRGLNGEKFAKKFGGGGHICAAGFGVTGTKRTVSTMTNTWAKEILQNG